MGGSRGGGREGFSKCVTKVVKVALISRSKEATDERMQKRISARCGESVVEVAA